MLVNEVGSWITDKIDILTGRPARPRPVDPSFKISTGTRPDPTGRPSPVRPDRFHLWSITYMCNTFTRANLPLYGYFLLSRVLSHCAIMFYRNQISRATNGSGGVTAGNCIFAFCFLHISESTYTSWLKPNHASFSCLLFFFLFCL